MDVAGGLDAGEDAGHGGRGYAAPGRPPAPDFACARGPARPLESEDRAPHLDRRPGRRRHHHRLGLVRGPHAGLRGPFDLLLHLILRDQVDLYEITLTEIVDAYLFELERMETLDLDIATEFLLIAATLVELKSRRLLPGDEDLDLDDELALWEERPAARPPPGVQDVQGASVVLARLASEAGRPTPYGGHGGALPLGGARPAGRRHRRVAARRLPPGARPKPQPRIDLTHVAPIRMSVAEAVEELLDELPSMGRIVPHPDPVLRGPRRR